jgi:hypothetical protein
MRGDPRDPEARPDLVGDLVRQVDGLVGRHDGQLRGGPERAVGLRPVDPHAPTDAATVHALADRVDDT